MDLLWVLILSSGLIAFFAIRSRLDHQRREALRRIALEIGYAFEPAANLWDQPFSEFPLFTIESRDRVFKNVMKSHGSAAPALVFDYQYVELQGKIRVRRIHTVAVFRVRQLPRFRLWPETAWDRVRGDQDIDFDSHRQFSKRYQLSGPDTAEIKRVFRPEILSFFTADEQLWHVEAGNQWLLVYRGGPIPPSGLRPFLLAATSISQLVSRP